jgi:hypothetical protein
MKVVVQVQTCGSYSAGAGLFAGMLGVRLCSELT